MTESMQDQIKKDISSNDVVLYMKGNKDMPQCGFSSVVCTILKNLNIEFKDFNVLLDNDLREGMKIYSDWPTFPQLYIKGEFVGGCDIVKEMYQSGELQELLKKQNMI